MGATLARELWGAIGGGEATLAGLDPAGLELLPGALPSSFAVEAFGAAAFAVLGLAAAEWSAAIGGSAHGRVRVDPAGVATALRSEQAVRIDGAAPGPVWDPLSRVFAAADGWVRLHGNDARHRAAIERVLGSLEPEAVAAAIAQQPADAVEAALHRGGGVAAAARTLDAWRGHPHGRTVGDLPLLDTVVRADQAPPVVAAATGGAATTVRATATGGAAERPRVLELTRVIAGPVAGRALAWFGADVLRIGAPGHEEHPAVIVDFGAGKRSTTLDLRDADGRRAFLDLIAGADVFLHGLRPGALERLGLGAEQRAAVRPGQIDASLSAYGATGGWAGRRGFDSLMQLSAGLAVAEAAAAGREPGPGGLPEPRALPCQILDHATGLLLAAGVLRALAARQIDGRGRTVTASLARTAAALAGHGGALLSDESAPLPPPPGTVELRGAHGTTLHAPVPVTVDGLPGAWRLAPPRPGEHAPSW